MKRTTWLFGILAITAACGLASCGKDKTSPADSGVSEGGTGTATCGDNKADGDEMCDGTDLKKETCTSATMGVKTGGTLSCTATCTFNVSKCTGDTKKDAGKDNDAGGGGTGG